jgi:hypothetical protein
VDYREGRAYHNRSLANAELTFSQDVPVIRHHVESVIVEDAERAMWDNIQVERK